MGETPYCQRKARAKGYSKQKVKKITDAMKRTILSEEIEDDGSEKIRQLKEKYEGTTKKSEQLQILTVLPKRWTARKIQEEFGVTNYMARKSKKLVEKKGILSLPGAKCGPSLPCETIELVQAF